MIGRPAERLRRDERGFGLVELLIALTIINIAIFAIYATFNAGAFAILRASRASTATTLGEKQMELYRGMVWANIGLRAVGGLDSTDGTHQGDPDWISESTQVAVSSCDSSSAPECQPIQPAVPGPDGVSYRLDTYVRSIPVTNGRNVKRVVVTVRKADTLTKVLARQISTFDQSTG